MTLHVALTVGKCSVFTIACTGTKKALLFRFSRLMILYVNLNMCVHIMFIVVISILVQILRKLLTNTGLKHIFHFYGKMHAHVDGAVKTVEKFISLADIAAIPVLGAD